jgi:hypothetical protein
MKSDYYTYAYLRKDGTPYYIGKWKGYRAFHKKRGEIKVPPVERILFLKRELTEEEAFRHEVYLIAVLGRKDLGTGILRNLTNGGEGSSGNVWSKGSREKMSKIHKGKKLSEEQIELMRRNSRGRRHTEKAKEKCRLAKLGNQWNVGRKHSQETIDKIKQSNSGRKRSEETKRRISEGKKGRCSERLKVALDQLKERVRGTKWWNNGVKSKRSVDCPGEGWKLGRK